jgi:hypothetical protein
MPKIVVVLDEDGRTIDGELPEGYQLIVHNHTGDPDLFSYEIETDDCHYPGAARREEGEGVQCFGYTES